MRKNEYSLYDIYMIENGIYKHIYVGKSNHDVLVRLKSHMNEENFLPYAQKCKCQILILDNATQTAHMEPLFIDKFRPTINNQHNHRTDDEVGKLDLWMEQIEWTDFEKYIVSRLEDEMGMAQLNSQITQLSDEIYERFVIGNGIVYELSAIDEELIDDPKEVFRWYRGAEWNESEEMGLAINNTDECSKAAITSFFPTSVVENTLIELTRSHNSNSDSDKLHDVLWINKEKYMPLSTQVIKEIRNTVIAIMSEEIVARCTQLEKLKTRRMVIQNKIDEKIRDEYSFYGLGKA